MSFMLLPPEVNSGRMYSGPGAGPMLVAASAWDGLAAELYSAAQEYGSAVSELAGGLWSGPSAAAMETAAAPQVAWLSNTATQAERAASQARAAVGAYEAAYAMTVPPPVVAANRMQYLQLVATNIFGQNAPAIAANEAQYAEMWAQDAEAMRDYATASAVHSTLTPFNSPQQNINPDAQEAQSAAVAHAVAATAGSQAHTMLSAGQQLLASGPPALQALATPAAAQASTLPPLFQFIYSLEPATNLSNIVSIYNQIQSGSFLALSWLEYGIWPISHAIFGLQETMVATGQIAGIPAAGLASDITVMPPDVGAASPGSGAVSAGTAEARLVGGLSVPQGWATAAPAMKLATAALPMTGLEAITGNGWFGGGMPPLGITPMMAMAGRGNPDEDKDSDDRESADREGQRSSASR
ncbi:MAG TPA: PPE family protein [Mycobacterium sp.]|nr:PPE family protein [Mycobacterium sp.]